MNPEESDQVVQRRANLEALKQLGVDAYPQRFDASTPIARLVADHGAKTSQELEVPRITTRVAGRVLAIRTFGKAGFLQLSDGRARVQVYVRQDSVPEKDFQIFRLLDIGDWVGVEGYLFRTKTNEFSVHVASLQFLSKSLLPLPEKWHGLQDIETRYRQRYLDLITNEQSRAVFAKRITILLEIRNFME
jgi:lysyl-tRNA synthetase class 2